MNDTSIADGIHDSLRRSRLELRYHKPSTHMLSTVFSFTLLIIVVVGVAKLAVIGIDRQAIVICEQLASQAKEFPLFWLTKSEKAMCDSIGIAIDAPVGNPNL